MAGKKQDTPNYQFADDVKTIEINRDAMTGLDHIKQAQNGSVESLSKIS
jgi:hypothetical protein